MAKERTYPMLSEGTLTPAYGRDYQSKAQALADLKAGKDFVFNSFRGASTYCSIRDAKAGETLTIRYAKLSKVFLYTVPAESVSVRG